MGVLMQCKQLVASPSLNIWNINNIKTYNIARKMMYKYTTHPAIDHIPYTVCLRRISLLDGYHLRHLR